MLSVGVATFSYQQRKTDANGKRKPFFFFTPGQLYSRNCNLGTTFTVFIPLRLTFLVKLICQCVITRMTSGRVFFSSVNL